MTGPRRRVEDHLHPEYWTEADQHRFEDRISRELNGIRGEVREAGTRITYLMGGLAVIAFLLPLVAPFIRGLFNIGP